MRYHLLKTFDKIYIIDLHGNSKKKEVCPDGSKDENVFDIMQGVAIIIGIKKKQKNKKLAELYLCDIYGKRDFKYDYLEKNSLKTLPFEKIGYKEPDFYFFKQNLGLSVDYEKFFSLNKIFKISGAGMVSKRDSLAYQYKREDVEEVVKNIYELSCEDIKNKYNKVSWDSRDGKVEFCKKSIMQTGINNELFVQVNFRPFDYRWTYYTGISKGFIGWPVEQVMKHFINKKNIGLVFSRQSIKHWNNIFITELIGEFNLTGSAGSLGSGYYHPLYLYPDENSLTNEPVPNFNMDIIKDIEKSLNLNFGNWTLVQSLEKAGGTEVPLPKEKIGGSEVLLPKKEFQALDLFDYIYAVLHSPNYREKYKEFLKIDFPRVPYPKPETFWQLVSLGGKLRSLHILEDTSIDERIIDIKGEGELLIKNSLNKKDFSIEDEKVELRLNDEVSVVNIPLVAWEFYIGGYQPAQKWLKDRVGRVLSRADMKHYNRIINALCKTDLIMKKIDEVL
ncbi:hypothetical protein NG776_05515 [Aliarcobacter cryaerophilus]|uniref:type ISP restriction/modification enzyme n=1 Tax=Aliarcobacter cryaerophilus TaxID=28198 RepID=UPI003DA1D7E2